MTFLIKNKMTATALAVCTVLGMGYSAMASAADSVHFTASIAVTSAYKCSYSTAAGADGTEWQLAWDLATDGAASGTLSFVKAQTAPLSVVVTSAEANAATCNLNDMKFSADMGNATNVVAGNDNAYKVETTDGFWRFMPVVAKLALFAGKDAATTPIALNEVKVTDANGTEHTQSATALSTAHSEIASGALADFGTLNAYNVSDNYLAANGVVPLAKGAAPVSVTYTNDDTTNTTVQSAILGVGVIVAGNPEDHTGVLNTHAVKNEENVSMPFTVNVDYA